MSFGREPRLGISLNVLVCFNPGWCKQPGGKEMYGRKSHLLPFSYRSEAQRARKVRMISREEPSADEKSMASDNNLN